MAQAWLELARQQQEQIQPEKGPAPIVAARPASGFS